MMRRRCTGVRELEFARKEAGDLDEAMKEEMAVGQSRGTRLGGGWRDGDDRFKYVVELEKLPDAKGKAFFLEACTFRHSVALLRRIECLITAYDRIGSN